MQLRLEETSVACATLLLTVDVARELVVAHLHSVLLIDEEVSWADTQIRIQAIANRVGSLKALEAADVEVR